MWLLTAILLAGAVLASWLVRRLRRPFPMPAPRHAVRVTEGVKVPMRDGAFLSTDLYVPEGAGERMPCVLFRTPYDKGGERKEGSEARMFAGQGYVVAVQDVRGRYESQGEFRFSSAQERTDGYDTVSWIASQPWSNGKVGTYGCSYLGEVQYLLAAMRHPNHAAAIAQSGCAWGGGGLRAFGFTRYGVPELAATFGWFRKQGDRGMSPLPEVDYGQALRHLPVADLMRTYGGFPDGFEAVVTRPPADPYWAYQEPVTEKDRFDVPTLHVNSWYDITPSSTLALFRLMRANAETARGRDHQHLIMSPSGHCDSESLRWLGRVGQRFLGDPRLDLYGTYVRWFDYWLKGLENGARSLPPVQIYVMGRNQWRSEEDWPLARARPTRYYLRSDGRANTRRGTGLLRPEPPGGEPPDVFEYDPADPVPSLGGGFCCTDALEAEPGGFDQSQIEMRPDVLVYTTPPLRQGVEVTGAIRAVLYVSSSAPDTDFTAKLVDVNPWGQAFNVQEGIVRARYREGLERTVWMRPDEVYEVVVDLEATSNYFGPRHRIRLEVSSSNFPRWERNLNTGGHNHDETLGQRARNAVHHSPRHASYLELPVVP
jgi:putative CocE/NonD family hydrolase